MSARIAVLNDEIYRISDAKFRKIMGLDKNYKTKITIMTTEETNKKHDNNCELVRKYGKKILVADVMLRDD